MRRFWLRCRHLLSPHRGDADLARELAAHLALLEEGHRRRGLSPDEARRAARLALGGVAQVTEQHREARSFAWLDDARRDARQAGRLLRRDPLFAATAVLSLAVGIGANSAIFTLGNALLLREPAGVVEAGRLVHVGTAHRGGGFNPSSYRVYLDVRERSTTLTGVYAHPMFPQAMSLSLGGGTAAERAFAQFVTSGYFTTLGAGPALGRLLDPGDGDRPGASPVAVLSHRYWTTRFGADPAILGHEVRLDDQRFTVIGVAREGFQGTGVVAADLWLPLGMAAGHELRQGGDRSGGSLVIGGRLKDRVSVAQATAEIEALGDALEREYPSPDAPRALRLAPAASVPGARGVLVGLVGFLMVIVALVLLVACANVAGILLARASARRREIAVRLAIGAGRSRLVRQLLMETMTLFALGGVAGVALARVMIALVVPLLPTLPFPVAVPLALDSRVVAFTIALSFVSALLSGLLPALQASRADVLTALKDDGQASLGRARLRGAFVVAQVALSLLLVVTAGLFVRALQSVGPDNAGFDVRGVELATVNLPSGGAPAAAGPQFWRELVERLRQSPRVRAATVARVLPGGFESIGMGGVDVPGAPADPAAPAFVPSWNIVEPDYFATLRIPLRAGRDFEAGDREGTQPVVILGEDAAQRLFPGRPAVGQTLRFRSGLDGRTQALLVVGVVGDVKSSSLVDGLAGSCIYLPLQQHASAQMTATMTLAARAGDGRRLTDEMRAVIAEISPGLSVAAAATLEESRALGLVPQRVAASLSGSLGLVGVVLAALGIYGVTAYAVARRTREIGIRLALGAPRGHIMRMVLRHGMTLAAFGSAIGLVLAAGAGQVIAGLLVGVAPLDPATFLGAATVFTLVALAASAIPARLATRIDPMTAVRRE